MNDSVPEGIPTGCNCASRWKVLIVDDDDDFQRATRFALMGVKVGGRDLDLLSANSMAQAASVIAAQRDIAVILLDVIMETDDAGLRLVRTVRERLGQPEIRIVLITGQPGLAPAARVMSDYDINDYFTKSELTAQRLQTTVTGAIRAFRQLMDISTAKRGLQMMVESSNRLIATRNLHDFGTIILEELGELLGAGPCPGILCARCNRNDEDETARIISASGRFKSLINQPIQSLDESPFASLVHESMREQTSIERDGYTALFCSREQAGADYVVLAEIGRALNDTERELLRVFAVNIAAGLCNVSLFSRVDQLAYADPLVALPNDNALIYAIDSLNQQGQSGGEHTLLVLGLDNFSGLNHAFGLEFGDRLLKELASRLRQAFEPLTMVARVHGDLFAVLGAASIVTPEAVRDALAAPFHIGDSRFNVSACTVAVNPAELSGRDALRLAFLTLKEAKGRGRGIHLPFTEALAHLAADRFALMQQLEQGVARNELFTLFQPLVDLEKRHLVGVEALVRWRHEGKLIPPDQFIPLAEKSALIHDIGWLVVRQSCALIRQLRDAGLPSILVHVNVSPRQFERPDFMDQLLAILHEENVAPASLGLEITETAMMSDFAAVSAMLDHYRQAGGVVAMDDFGTGLSSLAYLLRLPIDILKIDRTFVAELNSEGHHPKSLQIADMMVRLGLRMGLTLVAEGVETPYQHEWLKARGCQLGQGWLFDRPLDTDTLKSRLVADVAREEGAR